MSVGPAHGLDFEQPIFDLEEKIRVVEAEIPQNSAKEEEVRLLKRELANVTRNIYASLTPWQTVQVSRHKDRPQTADYLSLVFDEWVELHGDRLFGDDRAILSGFAKLDQYKVMVIGHQKGKTYKERSLSHFGCAHPWCLPRCRC
jgi:acetyl-CoA carboxylase carboxyl transferase subunit alpha